MKFDGSLALAAALSLASLDGGAAFVAPRPAAAALRPGAVPGVPDGSALAVSPGAGVDVAAVAASPLVTYFAEKVIDAAVPAAAAAAVVFFFFAQLKGSGKGGGFGGRDDEARETLTAVGELYSDLYGSSADRRGGGGGGGFGGMTNPFGPRGPPPLPKNVGLPARQYLTITSVNERYDAYDFALTGATASKARAAADFRSKAFDRALGIALNAEPDVAGSTVAEFLAPRVKAKLVQIEKRYLKQGKDAAAELQKVEGALAAAAMDAELTKLGERAEQMNEEDRTVMDAEVVNGTEVAANGTEATATAAAAAANPKEKGPPRGALLKEAAKLRTRLTELELDFVAQVLAAVGPKRALGLRNALLGDIAVRGAGSLLSSLEERPLSALLRADAADEAPRRSVFVMDFPGDVQASQLKELREEVTGVVRNARPGDEALVVLQSGGGTVTGYGLAAGQLVRLKEKGLKLTIAVEQVAASGGYMMSCVADRIVASPFAVIGSIGVISEVPNVYERLKEEGIEFQTVTAGKFKRTLTPTKKVTKQDLAKSTEDIEDIFQLFKGWVKENRPQLDIDAVATGETWFGPAALERGLCDEIKTVDDVVLDYIAEGRNVYRVKYDPPPEVPNQLQALFATGDRKVDGGDASLGRQAIRWLVRSFAEEVRAATATVGETPLEQKYMAKDDTQDRVKASANDSLFY